MPKISQSEIRKKDFYVIRDIQTTDVQKVIFPSNVQIGVVGLDQAPVSTFYGKLGLSIENPTATLHITQGSNVAGSAPIKFVSGSLMTTPEPGALEYDGTDIFYTITTDAQARRNITAKPYGFFVKTNSQAASPGNESVFSFTSTEHSSYVDLVGSSKIYPAYAGLYNLAFSIQFENTHSSDHIIYVWLKKDGNNITNSRSDTQILKKQGGVDGRTLLSLNFFEQINSGSYVELAWTCDNAGVSAQTLAALTGPDRPVSPAVMMTINKVD